MHARHTKDKGEPTYLDVGRRNDGLIIACAPHPQPSTAQHPAWETWSEVAACSDQDGAMEGIFESLTR